jgi:hypothetical protein
MFSLSESDLQLRILDCGGGPGSFNLDVTAGGGSVVSCDPLYAFSRTEIERRCRETQKYMVRKSRSHHDELNWSYLKSPEHLGKVRMATTQRFLADFEPGRKEGRYLALRLPVLELPDGAFDLALVANLLFHYSKALSQEFHVASVRELIRVAPEVRIYPLFAREIGVSPHLAPVIEAMERDGHTVTRERVPYEFFKGATEMLRVRRAENAEAM